MTSAHSIRFVSECRIRAEQLRLALLLFQRDAGRPAESLAELLEHKILDRVPLDPFSGEDFRYRLSAGEFLDWEPRDFEKTSSEWAAVPISDGAASGMAGSGMRAGGMGAARLGFAAPGESEGIVAGGSAVAAHPNFVAVPMRLKRLIRPGDGVLWSV
jgi:hypothetical protein